MSALEAWQKTCCYLYLPRLRDAETLRTTVDAGVASRAFFGVAYGCEEGRFQGFHFAENTTVILDDSLLLIEPKVAADFATKLAEVAAAREAEIKGKEAAGANALGLANGGWGGGTTSPGGGSGVGGSTHPRSDLGSAKVAKKTMFFGSVDLNPNQATSYSSPS